MRRREFITLFGGASAWPIIALAQERVRRVGAFINLPADDQQAQLYIASFQQGLQELILAASSRHISGHVRG